MGTTSNRAYRYPASTDNTQIWTHLQNLATDVDTDVQALDNALSKWTSFTPLLYTNITGSRSSISRTVQFGEYIVRNGICHAHAEVTAGALSTGGVALALPITATARWLTCGSGGIFGASAPTQSGVAYMGASLDVIVATTFTNGFLDIASAQTMRYSVTYRVA